MPVLWKKKPDDHDYPAAGDFLSMLTSPKKAALLVEELRGASVVHRKAKDILRASRLPLLPKDNEHVAGDLKEIAKKKPLAPVLGIRGDIVAGTPLVIADGYHRVCASYWTDENEDIPIKLVAFD